MRGFTVGGREYAALIVLGSDEFDAMEVVELADGRRAGLLLEFRMDDSSARLSYAAPEVPIPLLRAAVEIFREEFLEPRRAAGLPLPPW